VTQGLGEGTAARPFWYKASMAIVGSSGRLRDQAGEDRIKIRWLLRLHWAAVAGQAAAVVVVAAGGLLRLPVRTIVAILTLTVVANVAVELWQRQGRRVVPAFLGLFMVAVAVQLTALLALSGGYSNPFSTLYLVNIALATVLLPRAWSWAVLATSLAGFGALFAADLFPAAGLHLSPLDHQEMMRMHLRGMWVALTMAALFIVYVVERVTRALQRLEQELTAERSLSARKDKLASLATLAAGAAHELASPLTTVAVVTRELERALAGAGPGVREDLGLIRQQIERCQHILEQMSVRAGENSGEAPRVLSAREWADRTLDGVPDATRVKVVIAPAAREMSLAGPPAALARALRSLLQNALHASRPDSPVELRLEAFGGGLAASVVDRGSGIPPDLLARVGEPFFTTKPPGQGMGLGLFLARAMAEQLGGRLEVSSTLGEGTTAVLFVPSVARQPGG
jgi:two-component system sensor histidine kinase RegB